MIDLVRSALADASAALQQLMSNEQELDHILDAGAMLADCLAAKGHVFSCGNGGSMCDAMHLAEELSGRFRQDRPALAATAISDPSHLTCVANDYGYAQVFSRYIEGCGRSGDVLVAISTSGQSPSIVQAAAAAKKIGMRVIALTGRTGSPLEENADLCICTPGGQFADRTQELHIKVIHILIELIEMQLFGKL